MKKNYLLILIMILTLGITGCQGNSSPIDAGLSPTNSVTLKPQIQSSTPQIVSTMHPQQSPTVSKIPTESTAPTVTPTNTSTATPTIPPETRMQVQCLEVLPELPAGAVSNGVIVLGGGGGNDTFLHNMTTGEITHISTPNEIQHDHAVSLDRNLIAYLRVISDKDGKKILDKLVIATADGQIQKEIPWEEQWVKILRWTDDQRLLLTYNDPDLHARENLSTVFAYLLLDPFSGEQEIVLPVFPGYITNAKIPYWDGWYGVKYDPTVTSAIYPQMINDSDDFYTFALWDVSTQEIVSSMENIFVDWVPSSITSPKPVWSDDGSHFAFVGFDYLSDEPKFELYQVSHDGQIEQLTNLTPLVHFRDLPFNWSPDSRKIVMLLDIRPEVDGYDVLVLDLETKNITDTCISVRGNPDATEGYPLIWSPDGRQFLVKDWTDNSNSRIILVDIGQGFAAQIAENAGLNGWMASPQE